MAVRMKDIAEDVGVSLMTVSKALRGHVDIGRETRERILRRARELNYQPNWIARSLVTRQTFIVGLVIPDLMHSFFAEVATGLSKQLGPLGYQIVIANSNEDPASERAQIELLLARSVDGLVIASAQRDWRKGLPAALQTGDTPYVLIDRKPAAASVNFVGCRDEELGAIAARHLLEQGCVRLAHIRGPENPSGAARLRGFERALRKYGNKRITQHIVAGGSKDDEGYRGMQELLKLKPRPDGVFCFNDPIAVGAIRAIFDAGLRTPEDIAVIGAGNVRYSDLLRVPLSTIDQGASQMGETAADILIECMRSKTAREPKTVLIPPRLMVRESSLRKPR